MDSLNLVKESWEIDSPYPSPQMFEITYNDDFPINKSKKNLFDLKNAVTIDDAAGSKKREMFFSSLDSISVEPEDDETRPLNFGLATFLEELTVGEANDKLHRIIKPFFEEIFDEENMVVHYRKLGESSLFNQCLHFSRNFSKVDPSTGTTDERMTFFINIYNLIVLHMLYKLGPPQDLWQRRKMVNTTYYQIHEHKYSLHSILNGILRSNRKGHGMLWKPFGKEDLRLPLILSTCNPLIHFALISGTKSSPSLKAYSTQNIWMELRNNAIEYLLNDKNASIDTKRQTLRIPKIFKWFAVDFGGSQGSCLDWIMDILENNHTEKAEFLREVIESEEYRIDYTPYDWEYNGSEYQQDDF